MPDLDRLVEFYGLLLKQSLTGERIERLDPRLTKLLTMTMS